MKIENKLIILFFVLGISLYGKQPQNIEADSYAAPTAVNFLRVGDPWEGMNRRIYNFNYHFDNYLFLPAVRTYKFITPKLIRTGISNFYSNVNQTNVVLNSALQGKGRKFMRALGRFSINSILGIFGFLDVATKLEIPREYEDFGLTLAYYGVPKGPYLVLPLLGPSNLRDTVGQAGGFYASHYIVPYNYIGDINTNSPESIVLRSIDIREKNSFRYHETGSPFEYEYLRFFYNEMRVLQIQNNK